MRRALLLSLCATALSASPASAAGCANSGLTPTADNAAKVRTATVCLLNRARRAHGLRPLRQTATLERSAGDYTRRMVAERFFSHYSPDGTDPEMRNRAAGFVPSSGRYLVGENLGWGAEAQATPAGMVAAWMKSDGHRANILRKSFRRIGIGVTVGSPRDLADPSTAATYATEFGRIYS